jgi:hypothetical protein
MTSNKRPNVPEDISNEDLIPNICEKTGTQYSTRVSSHGFHYSDIKVEKIEIQRSIIVVIDLTRQCCKKSG